MGKACREIEGALQTEGKQTRRGYSIQGANARRHGTTGAHRKVQTNYRRMWMARGRQRQGSQECLGQKNPMVYQKCLDGEEDPDTLAVDRVIEIATDIYNSDCQRWNMQTLSTASAAATAMYQGSTQVHKKTTEKMEKGHTDRIDSIVPVANQIDRFDSV